MIRTHRQLPLAFALLAITACGEVRAPAAADGSHPRDIQKAEALYRQAIAVIDSDQATAEKLLRDALANDAYLGKAHNDLGVLFLKKDRLYDAAEEFEAARKNMPGQPEPRVNLAIALDRSGKYHEALDAARTALEVRSDNLPAIEMIALIQVRENLIDDATKNHLESIATRSADPVWREWARKKLLWLEGRATLNP